MNNMKAFVHKFRKSSENLKEDDEFFIERKQLNALHNYFSHSLLYLERLESVIKNINIMISDLNRSLMSFFENDVNLEIIKHVSYILNTFNDVREQITSHIVNSKSAANNTLEKIKSLQNLCIKKKNLGASIEHYEKKIRKLQMVTSSNQKHLDKVIRNEAKLNMVKSDFIKYHDNIKKGFEIILENKTNKVLFDARKDLEILLCYFSLMNSVSLKLKDPLKELVYNTKTLHLRIFQGAETRNCQGIDLFSSTNMCLNLCFKFHYSDAKKPKLPIDYNFFLEEEDSMNFFSEKKKAYNNQHQDNNLHRSNNHQNNYNNRHNNNHYHNSNHRYNNNQRCYNNPFTNNVPSLENKVCKKAISHDAFPQSYDKKDNSFFKIKNFLGVIDKSSSKAKNSSTSNIAPVFPQ
ncbi:conserved Plasmodium protein, unknown function [Plasmodium ovale curtisi]|uniref:Uncharacterized protein n=1 Tax=Plasmodium ovale curtisi TaxID=864141 RepID=A0A1A8VWD6_PLAOA|nr:conserved Plasmodium protein, unknown function [Plasmodium ovale curtisi]